MYRHYAKQRQRSKSCQIRMKWKCCISAMWYMFYGSFGAFDGNIYFGCDIRKSQYHVKNVIFFNLKISFKNIPSCLVEHKTCSVLSEYSLMSLFRHMITSSARIASPQDVVICSTFLTISQPKVSVLL